MILFDYFKTMKNFLFIFIFSPFCFYGQQYLTFNHNGIDRDFIYYEPNGLSDNAPLVVVAHGYSGSNSAIMSYSGMNGIANQNGFAVCYPKGTIDDMWGGQNFWNVGYDFHTSFTVDDVDFIVSLVNYLQTTYNLSEENTFMTGMSNGGELCYQIACESPGVFKAFAPVAGTIFPNGLSNNACNGSPVPIFEIHGDNDDVSLFEGDPNDQFWGPYLGIDSIVNIWTDINNLIELSIDTLPNINNNNKYTISYKYSSPGISEQVWLYKHKDGHSWDVDDISVEQEVWSFFSQYLTSSTLSVSQFDSFNDRKLIKVVNVLGQQVIPSSNKILFYVFNDGTVQKEIIMK
jgi:polyhydroxybutyrate depolymerase